MSGTSNIDPPRASDDEMAHDPLEPLRLALTPPGDIDVSGSVMAALEDEAAWGPLGDALRDGTAPPDVRLDLADAVLAALPGEDAVDAARLDAQPWDADLFRSALSPGAGGPPPRNAPPGSDADAVLARLPDAPEGWDDTAELLALGLSADAPDVTDAVMAALSADAPRPALRVVHGGDARPARTFPRGWIGAMGGLAAAAALAMAVLPRGADTPDSAVASAPAADVAPVRLDAAPRPLAARNDATVEALTTPGEVVAQVMQFEEGGPTIIFVTGASL
jgi:hypothetical protein